MMRHFQNRHMCRCAGQIRLEISSQKRRASRCVEKQDERVVVGDPWAGLPCCRWIQDREPSNRVSRLQPTDRNRVRRRVFKKVPIAGYHGIFAEPQFSDFEVADQTEEAVHVVVMGVGQNDGVQIPDAPRQQIWREDVFSNRKTTFVSKRAISARAYAAAVDHVSLSVRKFDQGGIALSDVKERERCMFRGGRTEIAGNEGRKQHEGSNRDGNQTTSVPIPNHERRGNQQQCEAGPHGRRR